MINLFIKRFLVLVLIVLPFSVSAQQNNIEKHALVIGNGAYTGLSVLANPVNDANDIAAVLEYLGFTVEVVLNGKMDAMENAVIRLGERLHKSKNSYGFFFYAGHGVQSGGENFLIPVDANIPGENYLRNRAVSVQTLLDDLNDAGNYLNIVVLDACRDNPFGWSRSASRGLSIVNKQPADSLIVYATSAGQTAADGDGRNGLFTSQLLQNLIDPSLEVKEVFNRTGADVAEVSNRQQIPAIYNQFFGTAYLAGSPDGADLKGRRPPSFQQGRATARDTEKKFWSIGASAGTSFSTPWLIATIKGTIAPIKYSFFNAGLDVGFATSNPYASSYYSLRPFLHYTFFMPITGLGGWYAGTGGSFLYEVYTFDDLPDPNNTASVDAVAGIVLFNVLEISYTGRMEVWRPDTEKKQFKGKFAIGYVYRFQ